MGMDDIGYFLTRGNARCPEICGILFSRGRSCGIIPLEQSREEVCKYFKGGWPTNKNIYAADIFDLPIMSLAEQRKGSERISQWEELMRKFAQSHKEECRVYSLAIPRVERSEKRFPTGSTYSGTWDVLGMSGEGTYTFPNGAIYQGQFEDGMFHGDGILKYPSGIQLKTKWRKGELIDKTLVYSDGSEYKADSTYCVLPDRRFTIEHEFGLQPAGKSYLTAEQPTREIPPGYYDTGDGFYNPNSRMIHKSENIHAILRAPSEYEQKWIMDNCRKSPIEPLGARKDLYEEWTEPRKSPIKPQKCSELCKCNCSCCIEMPCE